MPTKDGGMHRSKKVYAPKLCAQCGKSFVPPPTMYKRQTHCSIECGHAKARYTPEQRVAAFWRKVDKSGRCWVWKASKDIWGYGRFKRSDKLGAAHRFSYELANGPIPAGMLVLHSCDNASCVNPAHLRLGTDAENTADKMRRTPGFMVTHPKLTVEQVKEIRALYWSVRAGKKIVASNAVELSRRYGVTRGTITNAALANTWTHL